MALKKMIIQDNGVPTDYHRIYDIENIVNDCTILKIYSYINEDERTRDKNKPKYSIQEGDIYIVPSEEKIEYNDTLTAEEAYEYLKTTEKYNGAEDI